MQNPIYNGINRIALECGPSNTSRDELCSTLMEALESKLQLAVSQDKPAPNAIGILRVRLESEGSGSLRYRLVWVNDRPVRGGAMTFVGHWINSPSPAALVEALVATRP